MLHALATKYRTTAGRVVEDEPGEAHVSPLANPESFALQHSLTITNIRRAVTQTGLHVTVLFCTQSNEYATVAGSISDNRDDHCWTTIDDLEFTSESEASTMFDIAVHCMLGDCTPIPEESLQPAV